MTDAEKERGAAAGPPEDAGVRPETPEERDLSLQEERERSLTYEGTTVPWYVVVMWLVFLVWGVIYFLYFVPGSVREWFLGR